MILDRFIARDGSKYTFKKDHDRGVFTIYHNEELLAQYLEETEKRAKEYFSYLKQVYGEKR